MSALLPKADIGTQTRDVRFGFACAEDHIGYQKTITFLDRELRSFVTRKRPAHNVRFGDGNSSHLSAVRSIIRCPGDALRLRMAGARRIRTRSWQGGTKHEKIAACSR